MQEHGSFEMEIKDQTLIVKATGAWNYETALSFVEKYKKRISVFKNTPWACLVDLTQWELATPDVWALIDELNEWSNTQSQRYEAVVCSLSIQKVFLEKSHNVLTHVETKFCDDLDEAYQWLQTVDVLQKAP